MFKHFPTDIVNTNINYSSNSNVYRFEFQEITRLTNSKFKINPILRIKPTNAVIVKDSFIDNLRKKGSKLDLKRPCHFELCINRMIFENLDKPVVYAYFTCLLKEERLVFFEDFNYFKIDEGKKLQAFMQSPLKMFNKYESDILSFNDSMIIETAEYENIIKQWYELTTKN